MKVNLLFRAGPKKELIEVLAKWYVRKFGLTKSKYTLNVLLNQSPLMYGPHELGAVVDVRGYDIYIRIRSTLDKFKLIKTFGHEMVHVKQIAKGQLKAEERSFLWRGKRYPLTTRYSNRPWEIEAMSKEEILYRQVREHFRIYD
jgi:hypothetical protein